MTNLHLIAQSLNLINWTQCCTKITQFECHHRSKTTWRFSEDLLNRSETQTADPRSPVRGPNLTKYSINDVSMSTPINSSSLQLLLSEYVISKVLLRMKTMVNAGSDMIHPCLREYYVSVLYEQLALILNGSVNKTPAETCKLKLHCNFQKRSHNISRITEP